MLERSLRYKTNVLADEYASDSPYWWIPTDEVWSDLEEKDATNKRIMAIYNVWITVP